MALTRGRSALRRGFRILSVLLSGAAIILVGFPTLATGAVHSPVVARSGLAATLDPTAPRPPLPGPRAGVLSSAWENWPTYLGDGERTSANTAESTFGPKDLSHLALRWEVRTNGSVFASPAVVNGTVYIGSWDGYEYAINLSTGHIEWKTSLGINPTCYVQGIDSSATVWNNTVFVGGGSDYWYALNATTGAIDWKVFVGDDNNGNYNWASPLLFHGFAYIGVASCSDSPLVWGRLLQVNLTGNHTVFHAFDVVPKGIFAGSIWSSPAVDPATNTVFVSTGNDDGGPNENLTTAIVALNASTLTQVGHWRVPGVVGLDDDFAASPIVFHDASGRTLVGALNKDGTFYALNATNATTNGSWKPVWQFATGASSSQYAPAAFDGSTLYLAAGPATLGSTSYATVYYALDPSNGTVRWTAGSQNGTMYGGVDYYNGMTFNPAGSELEIRNASTGAYLHGFDVGSASGLLMAGTPAVVDGQVVFGSGNSLSTSSAGAIYDLGTPLSAGGNVSPFGQDANVPVQFRAFGHGGLPPYSAVWDFGDGTNGSGLAVSHVYPAGGSYNITANVTDAAGAHESLVFSVAVNSVLHAAVSAIPQGGDVPLVVAFQGTATGGSLPVRYQWEFGDGTQGSGPSPVHVYNRSGTFVVNLTATDLTGGRATGSTTVDVENPLALTATSSAPMGEAPFSIRFNATLQGGLSPSLPQWDFGDGSPTATGLSVTHVYTVAGDYLVTVNDSDTVGHYAARELNVTILPAVAASIRSSALGLICPGALESYSFRAVASGGVAPYTYAWEFGDGAGANGADVAVHNYSTAGAFTVSLSVVDAVHRSTNASIALQVPSQLCFTPGPGNNSTGGGPAAPAAPPFSGWTFALLGAIVVAAVVVAALLLVRRRPPRPLPVAA